MKYQNESTNDNELIFIETSLQNLKVDCEKCFGLCCVALYFGVSEGFPEDKPAGRACLNLEPDFRCRVHHELKDLGLKGCIAYDCFGAGQKTSQITYRGYDWRRDTEAADKMYDTFGKMRHLHEMLWYLTEAFSLQEEKDKKVAINSKLKELEQITLLKPDALIAVDVARLREEVNELLQKTSEMVRSKVDNVKKLPLKRRKTIGRGLDLIGVSLKGMDLRGVDLRGAFLIAADLSGADLSMADLIGADLRDANIRGAKLEDCIFLTQAQINSAKGDSSTSLPKAIDMPKHWMK